MIYGCTMGFTCLKESELIWGVKGELEMDKRLPNHVAYECKT